MVYSHTIGWIVHVYYEQFKYGSNERVYQIMPRLIGGSFSHMTRTGVLTDGLGFLVVPEQANIPVIDESMQICTELLMAATP